MAEKGYSGTTISMIVSRSGLPASSTYWHFGSKEALLAAVLEQAAAEYLASLPSVSDLSGDARERLRATLDPSRRQGVKPRFLRLLFLVALEHGDENGEVLRTARRVRNEVKQVFRSAFSEIYGAPKVKSEEVLVEDLATFALAVADGLFLAGEIDPRGTDRARMLTMIGDAFLLLADARQAN